MIAHVVVDVGNSRIKWGRCVPGAVVETVSLPPESPETWQQQSESWGLPRNATWLVAGVHPARISQLEEYLIGRGDTVRVLNDFRVLQLRVAVERPDLVGIDRLLDAVAVNSRRGERTPAVVIDAGSAVTVDWLDETGAFQGGAILPGFRLLSQSLHDYTALLPLVESPREPPPLPGKATATAMEAGVYWAVAGGITALIGEYSRRYAKQPEVYMTGGDARSLLPVLPSACHWPQLTLEGIRLTAEVLP